MGKKKIKKTHARYLIRDEWKINIKEPTGNKCVLDRKAVNQLRIWALKINK